MSQIKATVFSEFAKQLPYKIPEYMKPFIKALASGNGGFCFMCSRGFGQNTAYKLAKEYRKFLEGE